MRQRRTPWEKKQRQRVRSTERGDHQRGGSWREVWMRAWVNTENNTGSNTERAAACGCFPGVCALVALCSRAVSVDPLCLPPHGERRKCRCGTGTGVYRNPKIKIWENTARVPPQPQPLHGFRVFLTEGDIPTWPGPTVSFPYSCLLSQNHSVSGLSFITYKSSKLKT